MTKEQAIKLLSKDTSIDEIHRLRDKGLSHTEVTDKIQEAMDMGIEALEKQIPKKLHIYANGSEHCPNCDHDITQISFDDVYCSRCGQVLNKNETDE